MPKLVCPCDFVHDLSPVPDDGWLTIRDKEYEELIEIEKKKSNLSEEQKDTQEAWDLSSRIVETHGSLYECPECGRLMWKKPGAEAYDIYKLENRADPSNTEDEGYELPDKVFVAAFVALCVVIGVVVWCLIVIASGYLTR